MSLENLIKDNPGINLTVSSVDLMAFGEAIATNALKTFLKKNDEKIYSRQQVTEKFGICSTTLWRWDKMGLIESKKIGNRVFYAESGIKRLMSQKGGEK